MSERGWLGSVADPWADLTAEAAGVRVRGLGPSRRWSVRGAPADLDRLARAWGAPLPADMLTACSGCGRHALRLGPDEWLLLAGHDGCAEDLVALSQDPPFSLVDVSERSVALEIAGEGGATLLNAGNPLDLSAAAFPAGRCTRTVFGKAEIVLWRPDAAPTWRLEVWRSFAGYVARYITQAMADL